jgi:aspartate carbamoyltransferase regulatory subunit
MEDIKFGSLQELFIRVKPALRSKVKELKSVGYKFINETDVFNYLKDNKWCKKSNLTLSELVDDILTTPNDEFLNNAADKILKNDSVKINDNNIL